MNLLIDFKNQPHKYERWQAEICFINTRISLYRDEFKFQPTYISRKMGFDTIFNHSHHTKII